ncbi:unnamed protein product [Dracunculus medinensis]|uniref:ShKT domain-containing protein n=1 Tax=Dracunculus medinensis TaxID=318479 RepID=A0A0N4URM3_DRAME|nr:unnamed protein product [Dracunculus medinensis]
MYVALIVFSFVQKIYPQVVNNPVIDQCFVEVPGQGGAAVPGGVPGGAVANVRRPSPLANVRRPSPLAHACSNNNDAFCAAVFDLTTAQDLQNNANPMMAYKVNENCQKSALRGEAIRTCPRS